MSVFFAVLSGIWIMCWKNDDRSLDAHMKVISISTMLFTLVGGLGLVLS